MKIAIVISQFNKEISNALLDGAKACYEKNNFSNNDLLVYKVPGAFEIPSTVKQVLESSDNLDAIVTLGCVIKGETAHFEYISSSVTDSISQLSVESDIPVIYGILTVYDYEQAIERSEPSKKNKGGEVMQAAIDARKSWDKIIDVDVDY